jgi:hypothetical protein
LGLDVDQTTDTGTDVRSEIMVKNEQTIVQEDLGKDRYDVQCILRSINFEWNFFYR